MIKCGIFFQAMVYVDLDHDIKGINHFKIWTDKSRGNAWDKSRREDQIEAFHIDLDVSQIHILGRNDEAGLVSYHVIKVDNNRVVKGSYDGLNIHTKIKSHHTKVRG